MLLELVALFAILLYLTWEWLFGKTPANFPPGPMRLPIVGSLPFMAKDPLSAFKKWKAKYGPIVGLRFGDFNVVMIQGYDLIKEAYDRPELSGRPSLGPLLLIAGKEKRGLVASEGPHWSEQRRFALRNLRDFGFGKKSMEGVIQEDVTELIATLKGKEGQPISTERMLSLVVLSALWHIVAGERIAHDDSKAADILNTFKAVISSTSLSGPVFFMPWIARLFPNLTGWNSFANAIKKVKGFMSTRITEHKDAFDKNNLRDFMDVYLNEIHNTTDSESSFYKNVGEEHMLIACINLFGAGAETTSNTLNWAFYFLAKTPKVQQKMQEELDKVVGRNRLPGMNDKPNLPYTEAVMMETFRTSTILPFGVFHSTMEDTTFRGFELPKDTAIMVNLYDAHYDPEVWGDPNEFRPERFLSKDGTKLEKTPALRIMPFLVGKRACLGETLARSEFYHVLASVVQRFDIKFDPKTEIVDENIPALIRNPPKNKLIFKDRYD